MRAQKVERYYHWLRSRGIARGEAAEAGGRCTRSAEPAGGIQVISHCPTHQGASLPEGRQTLGEKNAELPWCPFSGASRRERGLRWVPPE